MNELNFIAFSETESRFLTEDEPVYIQDEGGVYIEADTGRGMYMQRRHDITIYRCTGLKDINGNLIYDGQILKDPHSGYECIVLYNGAFPFLKVIDDDDSYFHGFVLEDEYETYETIGHIRDKDIN